MNILAGVLLLYMAEERAFWTMICIIEELLQDYYGKSMIGITIDQAIFEELFTKKFSNLANHLVGVNFPISAVTFRWFICLFFGSLSTEVNRILI